MGAAGAHLSLTDNASEARLILGTGGLLGTSVHSLEEAQYAAHQGFDYAFFGPVRPTEKETVSIQGVGFGALREVCDGTSLRIIAIGGLSFQTEAEVLRAGAQGWAAIRCFLNGEQS
jgi:thiamine-phosphate pyrophosphorylase